MNTRVKNYTLDCGCFFEHKPQPGVESCYVLSSACPEHGTTRPVLSSPAPVNHDPFVGETATQRRDRDWILALKHAMDTNGIKGDTTYVVVMPDPHAAQRWLSEVIAVAFLRMNIPTKYAICVVVETPQPTQPSRVKHEQDQTTESE